MKRAATRLLCGALAAGMVFAAGTTVSAATSHYADGTTSSNWATWPEQWETIRKNYETVSLTPGRTASELNFAWYSKTGAAATPVVKLATKSDMSDAKTFRGTTMNAVGGYVSNRVTATGLKENTTYFYTYLNNGKESSPAQYRTRSFSQYKILFVGDPQIGASKGQTTSLGDKLESDTDVNTAARNDAFNWNVSLNTALKANPDISFMISAGDQINKNVDGTDPGNEMEYAGYLWPEALKSLPVATTIGNHDATNRSYTFHFNNPNPFTAEKSPTTAGNGYFYSYGDALFIVLNINNYNCADHEALIQKAIAAHPDTRWRIVQIHQDIYGSGEDHSESDGMVLRDQLTPIFDKYDVDVVLQGHDHSYSRSYLLQGDGKAHAKFGPAKLADGSFDWDNVADLATGKKYPFYPKEGDAAAAAANKYFLDQNHCYTLVGNGSNKVVNPQGTLYMTANSSSGSKFYNLISTQQDFVAYRNQNWKPSYSVISLDGDSFRIDTYSIIDGKPVEIDQPFTIQKTVDRTPTLSASANPAKTGASAVAAPKTGDDKNILAVVLLAAVAFAGLLALGADYLAKKKKASH
jgi:hypothetical protein